MSWTRPVDLRAQVQKWWDRGEILASLVTGKSVFPRYLMFKGPASGELADRFDEVRAWIADLREMPRCRVETRELRHRVLGQNAIPAEVWIDMVEDALALIGKQGEAARFNALIEQTRKRQPALLDWLAKRPLRALELFGEWGRLLDIAWLQAHPRPSMYLRINSCWAAR